MSPSLAGKPKMNDVTQILGRIEGGDAQATEQLFPIVYRELRRMARARMADEKVGQTLQATALVHEAYVRLVDAEQANRWNSRAHFFAAAAEAMRRILVERARSKARLKRGGDAQRVELVESAVVASNQNEDLLALDEALSELEIHHAQAAELVKLRYFVGMKHQDAAECLGISRRAATDSGCSHEHGSSNDSRTNSLKQG